MDSSPLGIYLHIPYCRVACPYCDFVKRATPGNAPTKFTDAIVLEIERFDGPNRALSISLGGGTPSLLTPEDLARILESLRDRFEMDDPEISIEVNPDDVDPAQLGAWKDAGINRVHLGVQSFDDEVLDGLGRCHDSTTATSACEAVAGAFENWGLDLIFGAPPTNAWKETLAECLRMSPPHVSCYGLTYEEGTPFWRQRDEAIDPDESLALYQQAIAALGEYEHYEISNFAKEGYRSVHNQIYWRNDTYVGFGPGAYSYMNTTRSRNQPRIDHYLRDPGTKVEAFKLSPEEIRVETLIQHLRTRQGIRADYYAQRFGTTMQDDFRTQIDALLERGLIEDTSDGFRPTNKGFELNNEIGLVLVG